MGGKNIANKGIVSDGKFNGEVPSGWKLYELPSIGRRAAGWKALQIAKDSGSKLLLLEDDVIVQANNGTTFMHDSEMPAGITIMSFFSGIPPWDLKFKRPHARLATIPAERWIHCQAALYSIEAINTLCAADPLSVRPELLPRGFDIAVADIVSKANIGDVGIVWPNIVQHRGMVSLAWPGRGKLLSRWCVDSAKDVPFKISDLPVEEEKGTWAIQ